jgi:MFS family permease
MDQPVKSGNATQNNGGEQDHRRQSRPSLDALSFFIADAQTGFGPYISSYLTHRGWSNTDIGNALSIGTFTSLISLLPAGAFVDRLHDKRIGAVAAWAIMATSAVLFAIAPRRVFVYLAEILHSFSTAMLVPAIAAISLALVGRKALGERLGRNARFAAIGNGATALLLGVAGTYLGAAAIFWLTAAFVIPGSLLLLRLPHPKEGPGQPDIAEGKAKKTDFNAWYADIAGLLARKGVWAFAVCVALFHLANGALMPLAGTVLAQTVGAAAPFYISACVAGPQTVVAALSPWIGRNEERHGVRMILMAGYLALPLRALLFALASMLGGWSPYAIVSAQLLDGVSAAVFGVSLPIMAADLTKGSNRFNLCLGFFGVAITAGATLSTFIAGRSAGALGYPIAFLILAICGAAAAASVLLTVPDGAGKIKGKEVHSYLANKGRTRRRKGESVAHRYRESIINRGHNATLRLRHAISKRSLGEPLWRLAKKALLAVRPPWVFGIALTSMIAGAILGPLLEISSRFQIVLNAMTTAISLLVLFWIQRLEHREMWASLLKLEELLHTKGSHPGIVSPEKMTDAELYEFEQEAQKLPEKFSAFIEADLQSVQEERARRARRASMKS